MERIKIIYKDYDFRHFCDDYEYKYSESYKNDIEFLNVKNYLGREEIVSIEPWSICWYDNNERQILFESPDKQDVFVNCSKSTFGKYIAECLDHLMQFKI